MTIFKDAGTSKGLFVLLVVHQGSKQVGLHLTEQAAWRALVEYVDGFSQDGSDIEETRVGRFFVDQDCFIMAEADATEVERYLHSFAMRLQEQ